MKGVLDFTVVVGVITLLRLPVTSVVSPLDMDIGEGTLTVGSALDASAVVAEVGPADGEIVVLGDAATVVVTTTEVVVTAVVVAEDDVDDVNVLPAAKELKVVTCLVPVLTLVKAELGILEVAGEVLP